MNQVIELEPKEELASTQIKTEDETIPDMIKGKMPLIYLTTSRSIKKFELLVLLMQFCRCFCNSGEKKDWNKVLELMTPENLSQFGIGLTDPNFTTLAQCL